MKRIGQFLKFSDKVMGESHHFIPEGILTVEGREIHYKQSTVQPTAPKEVEGPTYEKIRDIDIIYCAAATEMGLTFTSEILSGPSELVGKTFTSSARSAAQAREMSRMQLRQEVKDYSAKNAFDNSSSPPASPSPSVTPSNTLTPSITSTSSNPPEIALSHTEKAQQMGIGFFALFHTVGAPLIAATNYLLAEDVQVVKTISTVIKPTLTAASSEAIGYMVGGAAITLVIGGFVYAAKKAYDRRNPAPVEESRVFSL